MKGGLQFGAGLDVLFLTLDVRHEIGLNDASKLEHFNLKNNMFTFGLAGKYYRLKFGYRAPTWF